MSSMTNRMTNRMTSRGKSAPDGAGGLRLNRFLARAGCGSRRGVEQLVHEGRVAVNGTTVRDLAVRVDPARDHVEVAGRPVALPARWCAYAFHKPRGVVSTLRAQGGQRGLLGFRRQAGLPAGLVPVGRLDADTTGLLIWTDDGELAQALLRPSSAVWKRYLVTLDRPLDDAGARALRAGGLPLDGRPCLPARLRALPGEPGRRWSLDLQEGRNRQIRRVLAALGCRVLALHRVAVGPVSLGRLEPGAFRPLDAAELAALRRAAGLGPAGRHT